jgi:hydroxymethylbilane synthase
MTRSIRIATRTSELALWQAHKVGTQLACNGYAPEYIKISSTGDQIQDKSLEEIGGKGLFIKELEAALLRGSVDIAVHSLKDLPAKLEPEFRLAAYANYGSSRGDLLLLHPKYANQFSTAASALTDIKTVATGSARRRSYLAESFPHIKIELLRGNMQTRFRKLAESKTWDAIILAEAAYERLGSELPKGTLLPLNAKELTPAASQGIIGIETLESCPFDLGFLSEEKASYCAQKERELMRAMGAKCTTPVGCHVYEGPSGEWQLDLSLWSKGQSFYARELSADSSWLDIQKLDGCKELARKLSLHTQ